MEIQKRYEPQKVEKKIYKLWMESSFFNPDKLPKRHRKPYCITVPPPNITGELHMGHALNAVAQDILIRWKRMQGFKALWLPGTDHAGIATQNVVEKKLKKEGKTRFDLGREKFIKETWRWKKKYGNIILDQFKKMGSSLDWSRIKFTMDKDYAEAVQKSFAHYYKKGWIYRGKRVINWCPRCQTSLSDLEVNHKEEKGNLWHIKYPVKDTKEYITVATTRPETMLGDTAVAVNPKDKRYKELVGKKAILPLVNKEIPIIADRIIDIEFGTGALKVTPAHSFIDFEIGLRNNLEVVQVIGENKEMTENVPFCYQSLNIFQAREKVIKDLKDLKLLEKIEDYSHQIPVCDRCGTMVESIPSWQWFLKMDELARISKKTVKQGKIKFTPKRWENVYFDWLNNIRDWCISRQLWWGHRIPVWECRNKRIPEEKRYFLSLEKPNKCPLCKKCAPKQIPDVLDTWFSSALWPFATLNWPKECIKDKEKCIPKKDSDLERFYPTSTLSTDRGIINLWVTRMIFSGMEFMKKIPFKDVYIHATVLTKDGRRMSKSLGTGINPIELIEKYGADATRMGIAYQITELQDMRFSEDNIIMGKKFCNKVWNASRFVLMQTGKEKIKLREIKSTAKYLNSHDKRVLKSLEKTSNSVTKDLEKFRFGKAAHKLYNFFWHDFCDKYIENSKIKDESSKLEKEKTQKVLLYVLLTSLKLLHPFTPFLTEQIYQHLPLKEKEKCLMIEEWPH